jgi:8-oxo-dGTP pyrophosphatase MutT (NUDIX family)
VIVMRRGGKHSQRALEVLMLQRGTEARFMPGVWVFAGGVVEEADRQDAAAAPMDGVEPDELAHRICGARELGEEGGLTVEATSLLPWSRWITPEQVPMRFDTRFYVGLAPPHAKPEPDGVEMAAARWMAPADALDEYAEGRFELSFPTIRHLEELRGYPDADAVLADAAKRPVVPLTPKVIGTSEDSFEVLLPGEPGYDEA